MQPLFDTCHRELQQRQYADSLRLLSDLAREAATPEELIVAARVADAAMQPGLELRLIRRAARQEGCPAKAILYLAATYLEHGRYLEAEETLTPHLEAPAWSPAERAEGWGKLAVSYAGRRRFQSAAAALDRAAALAAGSGTEPEREVAYLRLSTLVYQDHWEESITELEAYIEAGGEEPRAYMLLAICHQHLGRPERAFQTIWAACDRFPESPPLWARAVSAAWAVGQTGQAHQALDRLAALLSSNRSTRMIAKMREMLAETGKRLPVPPLRQGYNHCFPACLTMVASFFDRPGDQRAIGAAVMDSDRGTPLFRALHYLEQEGWVCRTFRATPERIRALIDGGIPPILGLEWADGAHVHICVGYDQEYLLIQDPAGFHRRRLKLTRFDELYAHSDYWALAFAPRELTAALELLPVEDDRSIRAIQSCWEQLKAERVEEARSLFEQIDQAEPTVSTRLFRLRVWPRLGTKEGALAAVDWLLAALPDHRQVRLEVAQHLERLGELERAVALIREAAGSQPGRALMILARAARRDSLAEGCRLFRRAAIAEPDEPAPLAGWGETEAQAGNLEKAEALFQAAYEMDPSPRYTADLANLRHRQGQPAEAVAGFRQVLREERVYPWAWWRRAEAHWSMRQYRAAARCLRIAMAQEPDQPHFVERLSDLYSEVGQAERAIALLRESPLLTGSDDLQYSLAALLAGQRNWAETLSLAEQGMSQFPADLRFGAIAAEALRMTGRKEEGRALLGGLAEQNPNHAYVQARFSRFLLLERETEAGIRLLKRAQELEPEWTAPLDWAQGAARRMEKPEPLLTYLTERARELADEERLSDLAKLREELAYRWTSWKTVARANAADFGRATTALEAGEQEKAWEHALEALARDPDAIDFALRLLDQADANCAVAVLNQAIAQVGEDGQRERASFGYLLGVAHRKLGQMDQAIAAWEQAVVDLPGHRGATWQLASALGSRREYHKVVDLLAPLDETGQLPTDLEWLVAVYLTSCIYVNRPRRPHWRNLILERFPAALEEQRGLEADEDASAEAKALRRAEVRSLRALYERLEAEFGNLRAAGHGRRYTDGLAHLVRLTALWLGTRLQPPPLDVRPGESTAPVTDAPIAPADREPSLWGRMADIPFSLLLLVAIFLAKVSVLLPPVTWVLSAHAVLLFAAFALPVAGLMLVAIRTLRGKQ